MTTPKEPRKWTLGYDANFDAELPIVLSGPNIGPGEQETVVIEYSAYEQLKTELEVKTIEADELGEVARDTLKQLREYEHECETVKEMRKERDEARAKYHQAARDWDERMRMYREQATLLAEAEKALEFYANREHWEHSTAYAENTVICGDDHYCYKGNYFYGGKQAIAALAKIREKKGGV